MAVCVVIISQLIKHLIRTLETSVGLTCDVRITSCSPLWDKYSNVSVPKLPEILHCNCDSTAREELFQTMAVRNKES